MALVNFALTAAPNEAAYGQLEDRTRQLWQAGQVRQSVDYLRRMSELQPANDNLRYALALALLFAENETPGNAANRQKRLQECAGLFAISAERWAAVEAGQEIRPQSALRLLYQGLALWQLGQLEPALARFEASFQAHPARSDALYNRFAILEELGRTAEAEVALKRYYAAVSGTQP